jgi:hypothetical protein
MKYHIMISLTKGYLFEIWGEFLDKTGPESFTHEGYFKTREEAETRIKQLEGEQNG